MQTDMTGFLELLAGAIAIAAVYFLRLWIPLRLIREEQQNPATRFGSKKWHWPALTAAVLLQLAFLALIFLTRTPP
jgi:hypothetical protein